jgi:hypothetical protein
MPWPRSGIALHWWMRSGTPLVRRSSGLCRVLAECAVPQATSPPTCHGIASARRWAPCTPQWSFSCSRVSAQLVSHVLRCIDCVICPDVSPDFEDTWAFLDRSLRGVTEAGKTMNEISLARAPHRVAVSTAAHTLFACAGSSNCIPRRDQTL